MTRFPHYQLEKHSVILLIMRQGVEGNDEKRKEMIVHREGWTFQGRGENGRKVKDAEVKCAYVRSEGRRR